ICCLCSRFLSRRPPSSSLFPYTTLFRSLSGVTMGLLGWVGIRLRRVPYALPTMLLPVMVGWLLLTLGADTLVPGLSGTAHGAHFGGLITGMLLGLIWPVATQFKPSARGSHDT